jgi:hypothetical protein
VAGELRNWLPPSEVQQSTNTTMAGGGGSDPSGPANSASTSSGTVGRRALRFHHMSTWPV